MNSLMTADEFAIREIERLTAFDMEMAAMARVAKRQPKMSASAWWLLLSGDDALAEMDEFDDEIMEA